MPQPLPSPIPTLVVPASEPDPRSPRRIAAEFRAELDQGLTLACVGAAKAAPHSLLEHYTPRSRVDLFGTTFYLSSLRQNPDLRFFVAWVVPPASRRRTAWARIFYKDVSLIWRSASHFVRSDAENWIGKGAVRREKINGEELLVSAEETTDLPLEIQAAMDTLSRAQKRVATDERAVELVLRRGHDDRIEPYRDFSAPRERALRNPANRVHAGRRVARFQRKGDPSSLVFARGFEPDFKDGVLGSGESSSKMYGGRVRRFRIVSRNRRIQYLFFAGRKQIWISPPQATTTELSSFGLRTVDVLVDDDLCVPGYEFHYMDDSVDPPALVSQIPAGYVGKPSATDPDRADASAWLDALPVVRSFRREVLKQRR